MEIGDNLEMGVVGNTDIVSSTPFDTRAQFVYWMFTLNNYIDGDVERLEKRFKEGCQFYRFQKEVGEKCGTKHLQGVCHFKGKLRLKQLKDNYCNRANWRPTRSGAANDYCMKAATFDGERWEGGTMKELKGKTLKVPLLTQIITREMLKPRQIKIADKFLEKCGMWDRIVNWYWEHIGNWGKSVLCNYLIDQKGALVLAGAGKDAIHGFFSYVMENGKVPPIIVFDIPRSNDGHVSYNAIEQIKNGCIFNAKYEAGMLRFDKPHVIVFANEEPDVKKLSRDRWNIVELEEVEKEIL